MLRVLCLAAVVAAGSAKLLEDQQADQMGVEPVYQTNSNERLAAVKKNIDATASLQNVQEYVDNTEIQRIAKGTANPAALLSVSSEVHIHSAASEHVEDTESAFMHAELVHDLDEHMMTLAKDEKAVGPKIKSESSAQEERSHTQIPEAPPADLPEDMKQAFILHAQMYEQNFQEHFKGGLPHPASYLESTSTLSTTDSAGAPPGFQYKHTVYSEPQILLPVPAHYLYGAVSNQYAREQLIQKGLQEESRRQGERLAHSNNVNAGQPVSLMEAASTAEPAAGAAGGAVMDSVGADSSYMDPYSIITPAYMSLTNGAVGGVPGTYMTPSSMALQQGQASQNLMQNQIYAAASMRVPGVGVIGGAVNPLNQEANAVAGVQAPAPPLLPYQLPPPPYIAPVMPKGAAGGAEGASAAK